MELHQLRYALAVAEEGSFTRAAASCLVAQPALSQQIGRLEKDLGARLFDRSVRPTRLTAAGEAFVPQARVLLAGAERLRTHVEAAVGEIRGPLHLGAISTLAAVNLPAILRGYRTQYPHVHVSLRMGMSEELLESVRQGTLHAAFVGTVPTARLDGVQQCELAQEELVAVTAPGHRLGTDIPEGGRAELAQIAREPGVDFTRGTGARLQSDTAFNAQGLDREVIFEVSTAEFLAQLVAEGLGVGMLPESVAHTFPGLRVIRLHAPPMRVESLVWPLGHCTPATEAFIEVVTPGDIARP
ncbi:LysR family transcriptional regulator [Streptomyces halobius]|uniref:LysR family transcriptional regulator n=1 Tax=Streptomyces halobius TaxID=2879846 RepID=A0ABY4LYI2_9ACTN|nr:LysR substrate-binding domain-containing protein [Streptomyces halobius]UQA90552.1 LysR family transcriptional regulator [Streptomyces halobius]